MKLPANNIVNLTGKTITYLDGKGVSYDIPPSSQVAKLKQDDKAINDCCCSLPLVMSYGSDVAKADIQGLPTKTVDDRVMFYIVPKDVALIYSLQGNKDFNLIYPKTVSVAGHTDFGQYW